MSHQPITIRISDREHLLMLEVLALRFRCKPAEVVTRLIEQAHTALPRSPSR